MVLNEKRNLWDALSSIYGGFFFCTFNNPTKFFSAHEVLLSTFFFEHHKICQTLTDETISAMNYD
jgi:hypothetical protein